MALPHRAEEFGIPRATPIMLRPAGPAYQAYVILLSGFTLAPIIAGADKFLGFLADWSSYLHPAIPSILGIEAQTFMMGVGIVEIIAGLLVAIKPSVGGLVVGAWLCGIIVNLIAIPGFFDIALRDLGLALGAFALARLGRQFETVED